jgi:hypothetical protein
MRTNTRWQECRPLIGIINIKNLPKSLSVSYSKSVLGRLESSEFRSKSVLKVTWWLMIWMSLLTALTVCDTVAIMHQ